MPNKQERNACKKIKIASRPAFSIHRYNNEITDAIQDFYKEIASKSGFELDNDASSNSEHSFLNDI